MASRCSAIRGFTLIETLLVIAMTALLIGLLLPSLSHARNSARRVVSLANLRAHAQNVNAYADSYDGVLPCFADPRATYSIIRGGGETARVVYFESTIYWHVGMADEYYDGNLYSESFASPFDRDNVYSYLYSSTLISGPAFWNPSTRTGPEQWGAQRIDSVVFPSDKGCMIEQALGPDTEPRQLALLDGSAVSRHQEQLTKPYLRGEGNWPGSFFRSGRYVMHTVDGTAGRDLK